MLCFVSLFLAFSVTASAESIEVPESFTIGQSSYLKPEGNTYNFSPASLMFYPHNGTQETQSGAVSLNASQLVSNAYYQSHYSLVYDDGSVIMNGGENYDFRLNSIYFSCLVAPITNNTNKLYYVREPEVASVVLFYNDGSQETVTDKASVSWNSGTPLCNFSMSVSPKKDVTKVFIALRSSISKDFDKNDDKYTNKGIDYSVGMTAYYGEWNGDEDYHYTLEVENKEVGLLRGIIEWLKGLFNSIVELPQNLWNLISEGLKALFVPSEEYITGFKEDMNEMLSRKLGAVYQVIDITFNSWGDINANDENNVINLPKTSINLPGDNIFSFGGFDVQIVPNGLEWLAVAIKTFVGILCTVLFVNGLRKRYDSIIGG